MKVPVQWVQGGVAALALVFCVGADAAATSESAVRESQARDSERTAAVWNLTSDDWTRYEDLMRGRRGAWSPDADPLLVLGAHARTESERRRFAEAFVLAEHQRVEGELAFERAVQAAWKRLFPSRLRIAASAETVLGGAADRYALVLDRACADCGRRIADYLSAGAPVDVYVRGAADDADVRVWAGEQGIDPAVVRTGRVTLNRGEKAPAGPAPAVWARVAGSGWAPVE